MHTKRLSAVAAQFVAGLLAFTTAVPPLQAGTATYDFSADPTLDPDLTVVGNNDQPWVSTDGNPGGFLAMTYPENSMFVGIAFPDIDPGQIVTAFTFNADLRVGNSSGDRAADGFSISFAREDDPLLASLPTSLDTTANFAGGIPEGGSTTGIAVSFDTWSGNALPDAPDIEGIIVRVDNRTILREPLSTRHGQCEDPTSLQTGPRDPDFWTAAGDTRSPESWDTLCWQPFSVELDEDGKLTVTWKGNTILDQYQTDYFPSAGRLIFAGRTGGSNEHTHVDNISLTTTAITPDANAPTAPTNLTVDQAGARRVVLSWGAATDDSGRVAYEIERDGTALPFITSTTFSEMGLLPTTSYAYRVRAVDPSGNASAWVSVTATTVAEVSSQGFLTAEVYDGITGTAVEDLLDDPDFPDNPDRGFYITGLTFGEPAFGGTYGDNLGVRIAGTLTPPETGSYDFFVRSDDASMFFLNEAGPAIPDPFLTFPIAEETGCCNPFQEPGALQTTFAPISLQAGQEYGFLFLVKEGGGGDWGQVAWRRADDTTPAAQLAPIGGIYVKGMVDPVGGEVTITQPPQDMTVTEGRQAELSVTADTFSPYTDNVLYQWYKDGDPIEGATQATYRTGALSVGDSGAKYSVLVGVPGTLETSAEATVTVVPDTFPPVPTAGVLFRNGAYEIGVGFDEAVDTSDLVAGNFSISPGTISEFRYFDEGAPSNQAVVLRTSGLNEGDTVTVTVSNVADVKGNAIGTATTSVTIDDTFKWAAVGGNDYAVEDPANAALFPDDAIALSQSDFDLISGGSAHWDYYEEITFVYEEVTGDFDRKVRVEYQDPTSQWARAGLMLREELNEGLERADTFQPDDNPEGTKMSQTFTIRVNPAVQHSGAAGNNAYEIVHRPREGYRYTEFNAIYNIQNGFGGVPPYPDAWMRVKREGQMLSIYKSDDGQNWGTPATVTYADDPDTPETETLNDTLFVGPFYAPEYGNNDTRAGIGHSSVAKFRDYGAVTTDGGGGEVGDLTVSLSDAGVTITWEGDAVLQSADSLSPPINWTDVAGASSPYTTPPSGSEMYFQLRSP